MANHSRAEGRQQIHPQTEHCRTEKANKAKEPTSGGRVREWASVKVTFSRSPKEVSSQYIQGPGNLSERELKGKLAP